MGSYHIRAVLVQDSHPIAKLSKALVLRGSSRLIYEKEMMTIVLVVQKRRHYLLGSILTIWSYGLINTISNSSWNNVRSGPIIRIGYVNYLGMI